MLPCKAEHEAPELCSWHPSTVCALYSQMLLLDHTLTINSNLTMTICIPLGDQPPLRLLPSIFPPKVKSGPPGSPKFSAAALGLEPDPSSRLRC